jgi:hypothetical protein
MARMAAPKSATQNIPGRSGTPGHSHPSFEGVKKTWKE